MDKRHQHPVERNKESIKGMERGPSKTGAHKSCWSEEEVRLLEELDKKYKGYKNINAMIAKELKSKSAKQIAGKRCLFKAKEKVVEKEVDLYEELVRKGKEVASVYGLSKYLEESVKETGYLNQIGPEFKEILEDWFSKKERIEEIRKRIENVTVDVMVEMDE